MATFCDMAYTWDANKNKTSESITGVMSGYGFTSAGTTYVNEDLCFSSSLPPPASSLLIDIDANGTADVNFQYDALGRRVARSGTGGSVVYVQMDQQTIADYPVGGAATTPAFRYVYASYIDEPVVHKTAGTGGTLVYFHRNQQFSITAITNSTGAISERYAYSAYGQPTILDASGSSLSPQVSSLNNRYTYTGREWDATLGLHYFRARWMSPSAGRFITRDPIGLVGGPNLHEFIGSYPLDGVDPTGLFFQGSDGPPLTPVSFPRWWQVPPQQPPPPPQPAPPPPPPPQPPTHPLPPSRAEYCGPLSMKCPKEVGIDNVQASVIGNSPRAAAILAMGGMTNGCVTFPSGIECTMSCQALKTTMSGDNPRELILAHEACHYCALKLMNGTRCPEAGLLPYLGTITLAPDPCVGRERPVTIGW